MSGRIMATASAFSGYFEEALRVRGTGEVARVKESKIGVVDVSGGS